MVVFKALLSLKVNILVYHNKLKWYEKSNSKHLLHDILLTYTQIYDILWRAIMSVIENLESFEPRHYAHLYVKNVLFTSSAKLFLSSKISRSFAFKVFCMPSLILPKNVATLHVAFLFLPFSFFHFIKDI